MEAARRGYTDVCRVLVSQGHADVSLRNSNDNCTAKDYAIDNGRCNTPELLLLDSVAQRKIRAREARKAMGRSILNDFCPDIKLQRHGLGLACPPPFHSTVKRLRDLPLSKEYIDQMNSIVFQVGRNMERLAEDTDGEEREIRDDRDLHNEEVRNSKPKRRMSVQIGTTSEKASKNTIRRRSLPNEKGIKLSSSSDELSIETVSKVKSRPTPLKLPRVARTAKGAPPNLSSSPTSPPAYTSVSPRRTHSASTHTASAPVIKAANRQYGSRSTGNWAGKASSSVPSYLFRWSSRYDSNLLSLYYILLLLQNIDDVLWTVGPCRVSVTAWHEVLSICGVRYYQHIKIETYRSRFIALCIIVTYKLHCYVLYCQRIQPIE